MKPKVELKELSEAPNYQFLKDKFGVGDETIIPYGDKIFVKGKSLTQDLIIHELVHCQSQQFNRQSAERWWQKYYEDEDFRLKEEIMAYGQQYKFCIKVFKDRNKQAKILFALARELASSRYGNIIKHSEAMQKIKNYGII